MNAFRQPLLSALAGLALGCCLGFWLANSYSKGEQQRARGGTPPTVTKNSVGEKAAASDSETLTDEEIRQAIARADAAPQNREMQLNLGRALYLYAVQTRSAKVLPEAARLIRRAREARPDDQSTAVLFANVLFDLGQASDPKAMAEAREQYLQALKAKPGDADLLVNVGRTYYYERPPQPQPAIAAYRRALAANPRHEGALQNLVNALLDTNDLPEAERRLDEIESVNPNNPMLPTLRARLEQMKNAGR
ncbi:MAG TPA: tetratricopeptide repeat protein [Pyrinomonadaceae bacterium]|nr:tetratricopeptide repeat protein [Pyrinomonadaceae bacterium]